MKLRKLNLGCGSTKLKGYVNIDVEPKCKPDLIWDFTKKALPYKDKSVDEIVLFHTIEHIQKMLHSVILEECWRVLRLDSKIYISYPNFWECAKRWKENFQGKREFWHATMFGLQHYPSDYHVCAMDPIELKMTLLNVGFAEVRSKAEPNEPYNTITVANRGKVKGSVRYEDLVRQDMESTHFKKAS